MGFVWLWKAAGLLKIQIALAIGLAGMLGFLYLLRHSYPKFREWKTRKLLNQAKERTLANFPQETVQERCAFKCQSDFMDTKEGQESLTLFA